MVALLFPRAVGSARLAVTFDGKPVSVEGDTEFTIADF